MPSAQESPPAGCFVSFAVAALTVAVFHPWTLWLSGGFSVLMLIGYVAQRKETSGPTDSGQRWPREWQELPSEEKIRRVTVKRMPLQAGQTITTERSTKRYFLRVTPQAPGVFAFNDAAAVEVIVIAGSKREACERLGEVVTGRTNFWPEDSSMRSGECGRWYDGDKCRIELLRFEKNQ